MIGLLKSLRWRWILTLAALTPTCRRIVEQTSHAHEEPLPFHDRFRLQIHLGICTACRRYLRQIDLLRQACARSDEDFPATAGARLADVAKERLKQRLRCEQVG